MISIYNIDILYVIIDYLPLSNTVDLITELKILNYETTNILRNKYRLQKENWSKFLINKGIVLDIQNWDNKMFFTDCSFLELIRKQLSIIMSCVIIRNDICTAKNIKNISCTNKHKFYTKNGQRCKIHAKYEEKINLLLYLEIILFDYKNLFHSLSIKSPFSNRLL